VNVNHKPNYVKFLSISFISAIAFIFLYPCDFIYNTVATDSASVTGGDLEIKALNVEVWVALPILDPISWHGLPILDPISCLFYIEECKNATY